MRPFGPETGRRLSASGLWPKDRLSDSQVNSISVYTALAWSTRIDPSSPESRRFALLGDWSPSTSTSHCFRIQSLMQER